MDTEYSDDENYCSWLIMDLASATAAAVMENYYWQVL